MVYEWGTPVTYITLEEKKGDYEAKVGEIMKYFTKRSYQSDTKISPFEFESKSAIGLADKIKEEGHEPYYVRCEVTNYYPITVGVLVKWVYEVEITWHLKILKASPITWATLCDILIWCLLGIFIAYVLTLILTPIEQFWKLITQVGEAIGSALGLPAGAGTGLLVIGMIIFVILILVLIITRR